MRKRLSSLLASFLALSCLLTTASRSSAYQLDIKFFYTNSYTGQWTGGAPATCSASGYSGYYTVADGFTSMNAAVKAYHPDPNTDVFVSDSTNVYAQITLTPQGTEGPPSALQLWESGASLGQVEASATSATACGTLSAGSSVSGTNGFGDSFVQDPTQCTANYSKVQGDSNSPAGGRMIQLPISSATVDAQGRYVFTGPQRTLTASAGYTGTYNGTVFGSVTYGVKPVPTYDKIWDKAPAIVPGNWVQPALPHPNPLYVVEGQQVNLQMTAGSDTDTWYQGASSGTETQATPWRWEAEAGSFNNITTGTVIWTTPTLNSGEKYRDINPACNFVDLTTQQERKDDTVRKSIWIRVTQRVWETGTAIGVGRDSNGQQTIDGRLLQPLDQTTAGFTAKPIYMLPNSLIPCQIETASDWDVYYDKPNPTQPVQDKDTIADSDYVWSCAQGGQFEKTLPDGTVQTGTTLTGRNVGFRVPPQAAFGASYTIVCTVSNNSSNAIGTTDSGSRKDLAQFDLKRTQQVIVAGGAARITVHKVTAAPTATKPQQTQELTESTVLGGNRVFILNVRLDAGIRVTTGHRMLRIREMPDTVNGITHDSTQNHADFWVQFNDAYGWERLYDPDGAGPKVLDWWPAPEPPSAPPANTATEYRFKVFWNTATPVTSTLSGTATTLLGHNGAHKFTLESDIPTEADYINLGGTLPDTPGTGPWQANVNSKQYSVGNLTISNVTSNKGTPYYFRYYRYSDDAALRNPTVSFKINDAGNPSRYRWRVRVRSTDSEDWNGILIKGEVDSPGTVIAHINDPDADGQVQTDNAESGYEEIRDMGTYTFDISVEKIDAMGNLIGTDGDRQSYRSAVHLPYEMQGVLDANGNPVKGHSGEIITDANGIERYYVNYYIHDDTGLAVAGEQASLLQIQMLEPGMETIYAQNDASWVKTLNTPVQNKLLATFPAGARKMGTYITVFTALDSHAETYRDHKARATLTKNDRENGSPTLINDTRSGDRVVSAQDTTLGLPGGEKVVHIEILKTATVKLRVKRAPGAGGGSSGSAVFADPATGAPAGDTITLSGTSTQAVTVPNSNPARVTIPVKILGRQISDTARNMMIEMQSPDGKPTGYDFEGQQNEAPWMFTVFRIDIGAWTSGSIDNVMPNANDNTKGPWANAGDPHRGPTNKLNYYFKDLFSDAAGALGHKQLASKAYGGIVIRGRVIPAAVNPLDFNRTHSRSQSFNFNQLVSLRRYDNDGCFDVRNEDLVTYFPNLIAVDDMVDDTGGDDWEDDLPDADYGGDPDNLYLWLVDGPNQNGVVNNDTYIDRVRHAFKTTVQYGGVSASKTLNWYYRTSVVNPPGAVDMQTIDQTNPLYVIGDNEISADELLPVPAGVPQPKAYNPKPLTPNLSAQNFDFTVTGITPTSVARNAQTSGTVSGTGLAPAGVPVCTYLVYLLKDSSSDTGIYRVVSKPMDITVIGANDIVGDWRVPAQYLNEFGDGLVAFPTGAYKVIVVIGSRSKSNLTMQVTP